MSFINQFRAAIQVILIFDLFVLPPVVALSLCVRVELDKKHYLEIMKSLNQTDTQNKLQALLDRKYNYTDLLKWECERLNYTNGRITRHTDPIEILDYGKGRCMEFSVLYAGLCLANGYQSRLVVDMLGDHTWTEIELHGEWIHIDPSESRINDPYMYERDWGKHIELVFAFEEGYFEDVTDKYTALGKN